MATTTRTREDWLRAARLALLNPGPGGVSVEALARALKVTKGSFYWHFTDRRELMEALLREWEEEAQILTDALKSADPIAALPAIVEELGRRNLASERGDSPSDAAIFSWAAVDSHVALRTQRAERERMRLFRQLTGRGDLADLFYYAYHGFLLRRRRVPAAAADWASLSRLILQVFSRTARKKQKARPPSRTTRLASIAGVVGLAFLLLPGCTSMRIVRHRDPAADRPRELLKMRSGIASPRTNGGLMHDFRSDDARFFYTTNRESQLKKQRREDPPGARWAYKDSDTEALAWALERATHQPLAQQLEQGIWRPIGAEHDASWDLDHENGRESASSGLNATARDLARFGRLYLDDGMAGGQQVVPRE